jgi:hypothetical protein
LGCSFEVAKGAVANQQSQLARELTVMAHASSSACSGHASNAFPMKDQLFHTNIPNHMRSDGKGIGPQ